MHGSDMDPDPLQQLDDWAAKAQRRALRAHRWARLRRLRIRVRPRGARPRWPRAVLVLLLVAGLTASGLWLTRDRLPGFAAGTAAPYPTVTHPAGLSATSGATAAPTGPFDGTPAASYPRGAAGFTMPEARRVGAWSAAQVSDALGKVRAALVAMYVDRKALVDHDPSAVLRLVAKGHRPDIRRRYRDPAQSAPAVLISPGARLAAEPPRVSGRTTVRAARDEEGRAYLEIITNYVVVYAFDVPDLGPGTRLALEHFETTWWWYRGRPIRADHRGLWLGASDSYVFGMDCAEFAKGLLAPGQRWKLPPRPVSTEHPDSYFDPDRSLEVENGCG